MQAAYNGKMQAPCIPSGSLPGFRKRGVFEAIYLHVSTRDLHSCVVVCGLTQGLGLHSHDHSGHHHSDGTITVEPYTWKMLCTTLVIWLFFFIQIFLKWLKNILGQRGTSKASIIVVYVCVPVVYL